MSSLRNGCYFRRGVAPPHKLHRSFKAEKLLLRILSFDDRRLPLPVLEFCPNLLSPLPTSRPESFKRAISVSEAVALQSAVGVPLSNEHSWQSP